MGFYMIDENGKKRSIVAVHQCINGENVELKEGTLEYLLAVRKRVVQGVIYYGT